MKVKSVSISGFHKIQNEVTYQMDELNYIFGNNGAGKSSILQAIQLGFLGYIPGTKKRKSDIFKHCNGKSMSITLSLEGEDDVTITRTWVKKRNDVEESYTFESKNKVFECVEDIIGNLQIPIFDFDEFLGMTPNLQKELLASIVSSNMDEKDVKEVLRDVDTFNEEACSDLLDEICSRLSAIESIEDIKELNSILKEYESVTKTEYKRTQNTLQSLVYYDEFDGRLDEVEINSDIFKTKESLKSLQDCRNDISYYENYEQKLDKLLNAYDLSENEESDIELNNMVKDLEKYSLQSKNLNSEIMLIQKEMNSIESDIKAFKNILDSDGICPYTANECSTIKTKIQEINETKKELENNLNQLNTKRKEFMYEYDNVTSDINSLKSSIAEKKSLYDKKNMIEEDLLIVKLRLESKNIDFENIDGTISKLTNKLEDLHDELVQAKANNKFNEIQNTINTEIDALEVRLDWLKDAIKLTSVSGLQSDILKQPFEVISSFMGDMVDQMKFKLGSPHFIIEEKSNSFNFGFIRDDNFIQFSQLSSGEKCIFISIFLLALVESSDSHLKLIMMDDLFDHLDDNNYEIIMNHLKEISSDNQIIIAGVKPWISSDMQTTITDEKSCISAGINVIKL